eukprot:1592498-Pyramimonas_sp.AAC.2
MKSPWGGHGRRVGGKSGEELNWGEGRGGSPVVICSVRGFSAQFTRGMCDLPISKTLINNNIPSHAAKLSAVKCAHPPASHHDAGGGLAVD